MLKDITIGQYYPADSILHRLDPRVKLMGTLVYIIGLFLINTWTGYILAGLALVACIRLSKVPVKFMMRGLKGIIMILMLTVIFNLFLTPGEKILWQFWKFKITDTGLHTAAFMAIRLIFLIVGSSLMTLTTTPNDLTDGMEKGLSVFKKVHVPVHEIAMMMSIALRFIPILMEETDKIMKAQIARGADFESGNIFKKAKNLVPLLVPLFISAFRRASDLALAMEARCYHGGEGRTKMKPLKYAPRDFVGYFILALFLAAIIAIRILAPRLGLF